MARPRGPLRTFGYVTAALALGAWALLAAGCRGEEGPLLIGLAAPTSQPRGLSMQAGAELAVEEINGSGGIRGRVVELVVRDDRARADEAVRIAGELYDTPGLVAVVGHLTSGTTLAAAPVYNGGRDPVVAISPTATNPRIADAGPYTFRVCPHDLVHGERLAHFARGELDARRTAVLYQNDDYGRGVRTAFSTSFRALGGEVATEDPYLAGIPSFEPYVRRLAREGGAEVLMIAGTVDAARRILAAVDSVGLEARVMGGDGLVGLGSGEADAGGVYISAAYLADRPGERNADFVATYRDRFAGRMPDHRAAGAYDAVHLIARAVEEAGTDREAVRDYLAGVGTRTPAYGGVTGTIAFDGDGEVPRKDVVVGVVRDGRLVTVSRDGGPGAGAGR